MHLQGSVRHLTATMTPHVGGERTSPQIYASDLPPSDKLQTLLQGMGDGLTEKQVWMQALAEHTCSYRPFCMSFTVPVFALKHCIDVPVLRQGSGRRMRTSLTSGYALGQNQ